MNSDEIILSKEELCKQQKIELEILKEFICVCNTLKLRYYAICGTAIGAIRHKGFIPWDDDIDVCMPRPDYESFLRQGQKLLSPNLFLQTNLTDPSYPNNYAKIRDNTTTFVELAVKDINMNHGVYIDIFPIDGVSKNRFQRVIFKAMKLLYSMRINSIYHHSKCRHNRSFKGKILQLFSIIATCPFSLNEVITKRDKLFKKYSFDSCDIVANHCGAWGDREIFPKVYFGEGITKKFEGIDIVIPIKYDQLLKNVYGDYMKLPPEEQRVTHHYCTLIDLEKTYKYYMRGNKE